jgi:hypothetical protein
VYTTLMGGRYGPDHREPPFVAGHDGIGVIVKVFHTLSVARHCNTDETACPVPPQRISVPAHQ